MRRQNDMMIKITLSVLLGIISLFPTGIQAFLLLHPVFIGPIQNWFLSGMGIIVCLTCQLVILIVFIYVILILSEQLNKRECK